MKNSLLLAAILLLAFSCKKSSSSSPSSQSGPVLVSARVTGPGNQWWEYDTLVYDANKNIVRLSIYGGDSIGSGIEIDTGSYYLTLNASTGLPSSYHLLWNKEINYPSTFVNVDETHNLYYDSQSRLLEDSLVVNNVSANDPETATYYTYPSGYIISSGYDANFSPGVNFVDSMQFNSADNLIYQSEYSGMPGNQVQEDQTTFVNYSSYANPFYSSRYAMNLGVFLLDQVGVDGVSKNLLADNIVTFNRDSTGKIVSTVATDGTVTVYTYH